MAISLKVLAPNKNVYQGEAEEVILPSTTGQLGVLPGHISLVTAIDIGVLRLRMNSQWKSIALMGGFAEIESDEVIVLVNNAEIGSEINVQNAEQSLKEAKLAISKLSENEKNPERIKALKEVSKAEAMIQGAPLLLAGGKVLNFSDERLLNSFAERRYARSAICQDVEGKIKWFLVKGGDRFFYELGLFRSKGVSLKELQSLLLHEGCVEAMNLDGGYSAQLRYENITYLGLPFTLLPARNISSGFVVRPS